MSTFIRSLIYVNIIIIVKININFIFIVIIIISVGHFMEIMSPPHPYWRNNCYVTNILQLYTP